MGEYFSWVNVDRKEYICPYDFDYGNKRLESSQKESEVLKALRDLLSKEWRNCRIIWMGDECFIQDGVAEELFSDMKMQCKEPEVPGYLFDMVYTSYRNVSGLYKAAEKDVREEIQFYIEDMVNGERDVINAYGVSLDHPYKGLFERDWAMTRYIINHTKKVGYSSEKTRILWEDGEEDQRIDPLPVLLYYGKDKEPGEWLGDVIEASDDIPEGYTMLDCITLY